jgi:hypothetical protein
MKAEHTGGASRLVVGSISLWLDRFLEDQNARVVGRTWCRVAQRMARWAATEDNERQQEMGAGTNPAPENLTSSNKVLPQPLLECGQGKIHRYNNECGIGPAMGLGPEGDGGDVGSGLDKGPNGNGMASNRDKEAMETNDDEMSMAIEGVDNSITGALHPNDNKDCIRPSDTSLQTNGV